MSIKKHSCEKSAGENWINEIGSNNWWILFICGIMLGIFIGVYLAIKQGCVLW